MRRMQNVGLCKGFFLLLSVLVIMALIAGCTDRRSAPPELILSSVSSTDVQSLVRLNASGDIAKRAKLKSRDRGIVMFDAASDRVMVVSKGHVSFLEPVSFKKVREISLSATSDDAATPDAVAAPDIAGAQICGGKVFVYSGAQLYTFELNGDQSGKRTTLPKALRKSHFAGMACGNRGKQLTISLTGSRRALVTLDTRTIKIQNVIQDGSTTGLLSTTSQSGPLIAADPGRALLFVDVVAKDNARRNLLFRFNLLRGELERDIAFNTKSELLFHPIWIEDRLLMLLSGNAPFTFYDPTGIDLELVEEEEENHATFIDPLTFELKKVFELPNGQMAFPAYSERTEAIFLGIDDQVFKMDLNRGRLTNFSSVQGEQILSVSVR